MLSILIPTYNYDVFALVENLHKQCEKAEIDFEIIVLDDCSTKKNIVENNTKIQEFKNVNLLQNQVNLGRTQTRNILAEKAKYDWLLFLDSDVIPSFDNFIVNYLKVLNENTKVIIGGCSYAEFNNDLSYIFRWKYGKNREEVDASIRNKKPYGYVLSGNILINKQVFLKINFRKNMNLYGMDNYFAYQLYMNDIKVVHINNEIIHLGLEPNKTFFKKSLESVKNRKLLLADKDKIEEVNSLLKHYKRLKKFRLTGLVSFMFTISESFLRKMILNNNPNLFCFDLYRLGYICTLK